MPLASGLYVVVLFASIPRCWQSPVHRFEVKGVPRSDVISSGMPNLATHWFRSASTQLSVFATLMGTASGHLVDRSMIVNKYWWSLETGRGPPMSTWICPNLLLGCSNSPMPDSVCRWTFACWHWMQDLAQSLVSFAMPFHTNFSVISLVVVRREGCARPWTASKTSRLRPLGIQGLGLPVVTSQKLPQGLQKCIDQNGDYVEK